jgi:hypothetical protein
MRRLFTSLAVALVGFAALPGSAGAHDVGPLLPAKDIVRMWAPNPTCNPTGTFIYFGAATPFGTFPARFCTYADTAIGGPPDNFRYEVNFGAFAGLGTVIATGTPVCLNVQVNQAWERDLIVTSTNTLVFPYLSTLFVELVDNNAGSIASQLSGFPPDAAAVFQTPPGQTTCPAVPFATSPVTSGSVGIHDF